MNNRILNWRFFIILCVCFVLGLYAVPNFLSKDYSYLPSKKINYGLDLRGGSQLLLKIDFKSFITDQLDLTTDLLRKNLRKERIRYSNLKTQSDKILFQKSESTSIDKIKKIIRKVDRDLDVNLNGQTVHIYYSDQKLSELKKKVLEQTREIIRYRIDETGTKEPSIQQQGDLGILLQVPGLDDPSQIKRVLGKTAKLNFHLIDEDASLSQALKGFVPSSSKLLKGDDNNTLYIVKRKSVVGGDMLTDAKFSNNENGQPAVSFTFNTIGAKLFAEVTRTNRNKRLAIVLDNKVLSAPVINEPILSGSGIITGSFSVASANELALLLRAGSLPAPVQIAEEKIVGPSLGEDSIILGKKSAAIGIIAVIIFMIVTYGIYGIFASVALVFNIMFIISILTIIQATLTLPGIAGIVLTVGMAVDANVLIFERIREEATAFSKITDYSIKRGFEQAFATILDSNLTTLIAAFFLYIFGSGIIKGFAVTLTIGILSSMFTAITLTKIFITMWVGMKAKISTQH
ncbi:MAG: protein translocase subunit SecD [Alphaproteobacteria bacterium]|nr:protein translocase subunit SecD [Alphaproteobacteria bacterium]